MNLLWILIFGYALAVGFTDLLHFPWVGTKVQLPEFIFLFLAPVWMFQVFKKRILLHHPDKLDIAILIFIFAEFISALHAHAFLSWLEVVGSLYLFCVYYIFRTTLILSNHPRDIIISSMSGAGVTAALLGITGWIFAQYGIRTNLAWPTDSVFPYFGHIGRATGLLDSPNMLHNFLGICFLWLLVDTLQSKNKSLARYGILLLIAIGILLCFSKTTLLLLIVIIFLVNLHHHYGKLITFFLKSASVFLFLLCMIGTHFMLIHTPSEIWKTKDDQSYFDTIPLIRLDDHVIVPTSYSVLRTTALHAGLENPVFGLGPGAHNRYVAELKTKGKYPAYLQNYDPHSVFLGAFAELGAPGLMAVIWLVISIWTSLKKSNRNPFVPLIFRHSLTASLLFMLLEGINMDILNFRHLWILLGILGMASYLPNEKWKDQV